MNNRTTDGDAQSTDDSKQDIYGTLGSVTECATCPRQAAGERLQTLEHLDGYKRVWRLHLCRYCNRAFDLGCGNAPTLTPDGQIRSVDTDSDQNDA